MGDLQANSYCSDHSMLAFVTTHSTRGHHFAGGTISPHNIWAACLHKAFTIGGATPLLYQGSLPSQPYTPDCSLPRIARHSPGSLLSSFTPREQLARGDLHRNGQGSLPAIPGQPWQLAHDSSTARAACPRLQHSQGSLPATPAQPGQLARDSSTATAACHSLYTNAACHRDPHSLRSLPGGTQALLSIATHYTHLVETLLWPGSRLPLPRDPGPR